MIWFHSRKSGDLESLCPDNPRGTNALTFINYGVTEDGATNTSHRATTETVVNGNPYPKKRVERRPDHDTQLTEKILNRLWRCGYWQFIVFNYIAFLFMMQACWPIISQNFLGAEISFHCRPDPTLSNNSSEMTNVSLVSSTVCPKPQKNENYTTEETPACPFGYAFTPSKLWVRSSIVSEWNLVCSKGHLAETSHTVFWAGVLVGGAALPSLADYFGRKKIHIMCQVMGAAFGFGMALVPTFSQFMSLKFLVGVMREGVLITGIVWCLEFIPSHYRSICGIGFELYWSFHWCLITLLAYLIRDWRYLQISLSLPFLLSVSLIWLVPESPIWLMARKKYGDVREIIRLQANRVNRVNFPESLLNAMKPGTSQSSNNGVSSENEIKHLNILDIARSRRLAIWTSVLSLLWFQNVVGYYGLTFLSTFQAGDKYLNFLLNGLVEVPAYLFGMVVLHRLGRRWPLFIHQMLAGITLLVSGFLPSAYHKLEMCLLLLAKYSLTFCFGTLIVYTPEIYPTTLRVTGMGVNSVMGRLAGLIVPYSSAVYQIHPWVPAFCFGLLSIIAGVCGWIVLPETKGRAMPETLEQLDAWERSPLCPCLVKTVDPPAVEDSSTYQRNPSESHI